ncbi:uncharacterized protein LOC142317694 [Lycorma delicatula]|uniref:uncharacterized protein LOC142317694 n=1 Tax=Lycorma delicatula TaxID=130591 RepID=UPI003F519C4B
MTRIKSSQVALKSFKRKCIMTALKSALLFAAPVWGKDLEKRRNIQRMQSIHRKALLSVISAFRTISYEAAYVIATPVDILDPERTNRYGGMSKTEASFTAMNAWSERWRDGLKGVEGSFLI